MRFCGKALLFLCAVAASSAQAESASRAAVSIPTLLFNMATVALGELVVCFALGLPMIYGLKKLPGKLFGE